MTINKFNYEAFALDYLEGELSVELTEEMERFLATHPVIEAELSGMKEVVYLAPDTAIVFEDKALLLKEEKVVWLSKRWIRPLMAAASVALLLMTYFSGYQAGVKQGDRVVVMNGDNGSSSSSSSSVVATIEKKEAVEGEKTLELSVGEEMKLEKAVAKFTQKKLTKPTIIKHPTKNIGKEQLEEIRIMEPLNIVAEKLQIIENELIIPNVEQEIGTSRTLIILPTIGTINPVAVIYMGNVNNLHNLESALISDVPVAELAGITIQKRKRSIKDFLGRFPVTQLKEALIPTYYKEENAGQ